MIASAHHILFLFPRTPSIQRVVMMMRMAHPLRLTETIGDFEPPLARERQSMTMRKAVSGRSAWLRLPKDPRAARCAVLS